MRAASSCYVLEFSFSQRCFHIATLSDALAMNAEAFASNRAADYVPLHIFLTHEAASAACEGLKPLRDARECRRRK
jgi:hypothetical protein